MPASMPRKTPGKLPPPPDAAEFARLPLGRLCQMVSGVYYRLHTLDPKTRKLYGPVFFSRHGTSRFDPAQGIGTLCVADSLTGAILEKFGDRLEPLGSLGRALSRQMLGDWFATLVSVPQVKLFEASGANLSKLGVDLQLLAGEHAVTRSWALRLMEHPARIGGILYPSRHDDTRRNVALFKQSKLLPAQQEDSLTPPASAQGIFAARKRGTLLHGRAVLLRDHPELSAALQELEVGVIK